VEKLAGIFSRGVFGLFWGVFEFFRGVSGTSPYHKGFFSPPAGLFSAGFVPACS
jgi:hypothetical protein